VVGVGAPDGVVRYTGIGAGIALLPLPGRKYRRQNSVCPGFSNVPAFVQR
jgi:hypothetical protein